jgi:hypothetical protein
MLNTAAAILTILFAPASPDDSKIKFEPAPKVGASYSLKFTIDAHVGDHENKLNGTAVTTVSKVGPDRTEYSLDWKNLEVSSDDAPADLPFTPYQAAVGPAGQLLDLTGGMPVQVADPASVFLCSYFPVTSMELTKGTPISFVLPANEKEHIPEMKASETLAGVETLQNVDAYKISVKLQDSKSDFVVEATYWVDKAGNVLKEDGTFKNLGIPGMTVDGTVKTSAVTK